MLIVPLTSWSEFENAIADIRGKFASRTVELDEGREVVMKNEVLFRGQTDSEWELKTTLERTTDTKYSLEDYLQRADLVVNQIESVTGTKWQLPTHPVTCGQIAAGQDSMHLFLPSPWYEYLVYLRHHGFPSPLLDWTRSPYVAAYFAMEQRSEATHCSVFAFIERPEGGKSFRGGDVTITSKGPYITTTPRHFAQKASYTLATQWDSTAEHHYFSPHQAVTPCPRRCERSSRRRSKTPI